MIPTALIATIVAPGSYLIKLERTRPQPPQDRPARLRQDDGDPAVARAPASPDPGREHRRHQGAISGCGGTPFGPGTAVSLPGTGINTAGLIGGGSIPCTGEFTLGHAGVFFLGELPEVRRDTLESLRRPLEDGELPSSAPSHGSPTRLDVSWPAP
ncbi:MAG: ATP-binding protein [Deltaproteobacteria bacterium]|nr:ATP-binding protein [Deltaproteobacteria bacterium]